MHPEEIVPGLYINKMPPDGCNNMVMRIRDKVTADEIKIVLFFILCDESKPELN